MVSVAKIMRRPWIVGTGQVHWLLLWKFKRFYSKLREERNTRSPDSPWPRWATLHCTALPDSRGAQINRISIVESTIQDTSGLTTTTNQPHALLLIFKIRELLDLIEDFGSGSIFNTTETELNYFLVRTEWAQQIVAQCTQCSVIIIKCINRTGCGVAYSRL